MQSLKDDAEELEEEKEDFRRRVPAGDRAPGWEPVVAVARLPGLRDVMLRTLNLQAGASTRVGARIPVPPGRSKC